MKQNKSQFLFQIQSLLEGNEPMEEGVGSSSTDPDQLVAYIDEMESKISMLQGQVAEEEVKMERYKVGLKVGLANTP